MGGARHKLCPGIEPATRTSDQRLLSLPLDGATSGSLPPRESKLFPPFPRLSVLDRFIRATCCGDAAARLHLGTKDAWGYRGDETALRFREINWVFVFKFERHMGLQGSRTHMSGTITESSPYIIRQRKKTRRNLPPTTLSRSPLSASRQHQTRSYLRHLSPFGCYGWRHYFPPFPSVLLPCRPSSAGVVGCSVENAQPGTLLGRHAFAHCSRTPEHEARGNVD